MTFVPVVVTDVLTEVFTGGLTTIALRTVGGGGPSMMNVWPLLSVSPRYEASRCQRPWRSFEPVSSKRCRQTGQRPWRLTRDTGTRRPAPHGQTKRTFSAAAGAGAGATGRVRMVLLSMIPLVEPTSS